MLSTEKDAAQDAPAAEDRERGGLRQAGQGAGQAAGRAGDQAAGRAGDQAAGRAGDQAAGRAAVLEELRRLQASPTLQRATGLSGLLGFLVECELAGDAAYLKETYIGHAFYGREPDYDPKADALVRVNANRLRVRLKEIYAQEAAVRVRIELPRGSYVPQYVWVEQAADEEPDATAGGAEPAVALEGGETTEAVPLAAEAVAVEVPPALPARRRLLWPLVVAGAAAAGALAGVALWRQPAAQRRWEVRPFTRLSGMQVFPAFAPDGRTIAFVGSRDGEGDRSALYVRRLGTEAVEQVTDGTAEDTRPAWSPDGTALAYLRLLPDGGKELRVLDRRAGSAAGTSRVVARLHGAYPWLCQVSRVAWTRDGRRLITAESAAPDAPCRIVGIDVATGAVTPLTTGGDRSQADVEPAVSPDGRRIVFLRNQGTLVGDLYVMNLDGGELQRVTHDDSDIMGEAWQADGRGLVFVSRRGDGVLRLWRTRLDGGTPERVADGLVDVGFPTVSRNGRQMMVSVYKNTLNVWRVYADGRPAERLFVGDGVNADAVTSPDGSRIALRSDRSGATELWVSDRDGGSLRQLTNFEGPFVTRPAWSADGQTLAFECRDRGHVDVCVVPAAGGAVRHVTEWTTRQERPAWSRDGRWLYFLSDRTGRDEVFAVPAGGGTPVQRTRDGALRVVPAVDGAGLLVARGGPPPGIYAEPETGEPMAPAAGAGPMVPMSATEALDRWDAAPGGVWWVEGEHGTTRILRWVAQRGRSEPAAVFPHALVQGDQALAVEPGGRSALVVEQGLRGANLDLLTESAAR